jgi:hypothetical protein
VIIIIVRVDRLDPPLPTLTAPDNPNTSPQRKLLDFNLFWAKNVRIKLGFEIFRSISVSNSAGLCDRDPNQFAQTDRILIVTTSILTAKSIGWLSK